MSQRTVTAYVVRRPTRSLDFVPFAHPIAGRPVLHYLLHRVSTECPHTRIVLLVEDQCDVPFVNAEAAPFNAQVVALERRSAVSALRDLLETDAVDVCAFVHLEYLLAPEGLLSQVINLSLEAGSQLTTCRGLPYSVRPLVAHREVIELISEVKLPGVALTAAGLSNLATVLGSHDAITVNEIPASMLVGEDCGDIPLRVSCESGPGMRWLAAVLRDEHDEMPTSRWGRLRRWAALERQVVHAVQVRLRHPARLEPSERPQTRPKVMYVSDQSGFSGAEESLCQMVGKLSVDLVEKYALVGARGKFSRRLEESGVTVISDDRGFSEPSYSSVMFVSSVLRDVRPDIVHLNSPQGLPVVAVAKAFGASIVQHVRNSRMEAYEPTIVAADAIIAVSRYVAKRLDRFPIDQSKVSVIYDEVDCSRYVMREIASRPPLDATSARSILCIARLAREKRHDILLKSFAKVLDAVPGAKLLLKGEAFGHDEYAESVWRLADELRIGDKIEWIPFCEDLRFLILRSDVLVLCSDEEALGRCVVEAMALGVPVVVTNGGGTHELVRNGHCGVVAEAGDATSLAKGILRILSDETFAAECAARARVVVEKTCDSQITARDVYSVYRALVEGRPHDESSPDVCWQSPSLL